jgi:hypothetical protein
MTKSVKYGRWKPEDIEKDLEAFRNGGVALNAASCKYPVPKPLLKRYLDVKNYFVAENNQVIVQGELVFYLEQYKFYITITDYEVWHFYFLNEIILPTDQIILRTSAGNSVFPSFPAPAYFELASARMGYANNYISS